MLSSCLETCGTALDGAPPQVSEERSSARSDAGDARVSALQPASELVAGERPGRRRIPIVWLKPKALGAIRDEYHPHRFDLRDLRLQRFEGQVAWPLQMLSLRALTDEVPGQCPLRPAGQGWDMTQRKRLNPKRVVSREAACLLGDRIPAFGRPNLGRGLPALHHLRKHVIQIRTGNTIKNLSVVAGLE